MKTALTDRQFVDLLAAVRCRIDACADNLSFYDPENPYFVNTAGMADEQRTLARWQRVYDKVSSMRREARKSKPGRAKR